MVARFREDADGPYVRLDFRPPWPREPGDGYLGAVVRLTRTVPARGGVRWWFVCPGPGCGKRVGKLYLPWGGTEWRCRGCHSLTYVSQQDSRRVDLLCAWTARTFGIDGVALRECLRRRPPKTLDTLFPRPARPRRRAQRGVNRLTRHPAPGPRPARGRGGG